MAEKLIITLDELNSPRVDAKLREHQLVSRTQEHYEQASLPAATAPRRQWTFLYNTFFYMGVFGLLGGLLGWAGGEVMHLRPNARMEVRELIAAEEEIHAARRIQRLTDAEAEIALQEMRRGARQNPYYAIHIDSTLSPAEKQARWAEIARRDEWKEYLANVLFYGMCGMMIAACLSAAERIIDRNWAGAALYASAGAVAGLAGGLIVSLFVDRLYDAILGGPAGQASLLWQTLARTAAWAVLGLFLGSAPGIVLRNRRRLLIGMAGGLIGGIVGGALFDPIASWTSNQHLSRLVAILAVGLVAGIGTGFIEHAAKSGWFKVSTGLIAGKQFVLYRNPTYIGASPQSHIYLFKDPEVGKRHAAVHITPAGYELEDLPLGGKTFVNDRPVTRARLRSGDRVRVGRTTFTFQEKPKPA